MPKLPPLSKTTLSRYLNHPSLTIKTKQKLHKIIQQHHYHPNQFPQTLTPHP
ncbi:LacI family DNA-binding transcriptional regulator, partial [Staphylococcus saprophyticus]|uniref:LacI family DNA-binding transcriptional regulator n=1 Tax=Staphylococcus saprophyticus TaxID=29385 RepID=UPI0021B3796B